MDKELIQLAEMVMPRNWHIVTKECEFLKGHVYITLFVFDDYDLAEEEDCVGRVKGGMRFFEGSAVAHIDLFIPDKITLIHELAHIGQYRIHAWYVGPKERNGAGFLILTPSPVKEEDHDKDFLTAYRCLIERAKPYMNDLELRTLKADFNLHERRVV